MLSRRSLGGVALVAAVGGVLWLTGCGTPAQQFACQSSSDCNLMPKGICEAATQYCAYPSAGCTSGYRYSSTAGGGFGSMCVGGPAPEMGLADQSLTTDQGSRESFADGPSRDASDAEAITTLDAPRPDHNQPVDAGHADACGPPPYFNCSVGGCTNTNTDINNCGGCGHGCGIGGQETCSGGQCQCIFNDGPGMVCADTAGGQECWDTNSDPMHCGSCGNVCPTPSGGVPVCYNGQCCVGPFGLCSWGPGCSGELCAYGGGNTEYCLDDGQPTLKGSNPGCCYGNQGGTCCSVFTEPCTIGSLAGDYCCSTDPSSGLTLACGSSGKCCVPTGSYCQQNGDCCNGTCNGAGTSSAACN
jgi:hypothetical protein